jgi:hypothetical protein
MNIRRGLFRVWVSLTLLWACLIGFITYYDGQNFLRPFTLKTANYQLEFPGTTSRETVRKALLTFFKNERDKRSPDYNGVPESDAVEISQQFRGEDFPEFLTRTAILFVAFPLASFGLGFLLLWIGAGFVRHASDARAS